MANPPPDIVLLATEWRPRALLRAQLIEAGFDVVAMDTWTSMRRSLRPGLKPLIAIADLQGLPEPDRVLNDLKILMKASRVLVLAAMGTVSPDRIGALGFHVIKRPVDIDSVVVAATRMISAIRKKAESPL